MVDYLMGLYYLEAWVEQGQPAPLLIVSGVFYAHGLSMRLRAHSLLLYTYLSTVFGSRKGARSHMLSLCGSLVLFNQAQVATTTGGALLPSCVKMMRYSGEAS